jgi:Domain of unknown function (DUF6089)
MHKKIIIICYCCCAFLSSKAQLFETFVHQGELGVSVGLGHYFGDLNPDLAINAPKFAAGVFYRKQINNYVGVKISGNYTFLGYSDTYSSNATQRRRNLSFNTDVWELSVAGDFNFYEFHPGFWEYRYTPYVSLGLGVFSFDPYAYLNSKKYFLQPLGTEGQGSPLYPSKKPYSLIAVSIPVGVGFKYALNERINLFTELCFRFTTTDYLDDVSGTYAPDAFPPDANGNPTAAYLLQDRSYETGTSIGVKGKQRGNGPQTDAFATLQFGVSFNLQSYKCPKH